MLPAVLLTARGYLTGQAYIDDKYTEVGTKIFIFQGSPNSAGKAPAELETGNRVTLPSPALIVSRFAKLK